MGASRKFVVFATVLVFVGAALLSKPAKGIGSVEAPAQGSVAGHIAFTGVAPEPTAAALAADPYCSSQHSEAMMLRPVDVGDSGGLRHVVVYLRDARGGGGNAEVVFDQKGCVYTPHVLRATVGQTVVFRNSDQTLHSIHVRPTASPEFNVGQPLQGMETRRVFNSPEIGIPIRCDVHPWMTAFLSVFGHPYHATTDDDGNFTIDQIPDGSYVIEARHEVLGTLTREIIISGGRTTVTFEFS